MSNEPNFPGFGGFRKTGKSEWNMTSHYFILLSGLMQDIAEHGFKAMSGLRNREIISYYSLVNQYYILLSPNMKVDELSMFEEAFMIIEKNIDFNARYVNNKYHVVRMIKDAQMELYRITQKRGMLIQMVYQSNEFKEAEKRLGLR